VDGGKGLHSAVSDPRGSTHVRQDFGNIIQYRYPGDDFKDLMAGVDELIAPGWVDPENWRSLAAVGAASSPNWAVGHTDRFKAAVSQRSIADWSGWWYTADVIVASLVPRSTLEVRSGFQRAVAHYVCAKILRHP